MGREIAMEQQLLDHSARAIPKTSRMLRHVLPIVCLGVLGNLLFSWYTTSRGEQLDWTQFSLGYFALAGILALLPWAWHALRVAIWLRFFGVRISVLHLFRVVVANDVGSVVSPAVVGGTPFKMGMLVQHGVPPGHAATLALLGQLEEALFFILLIPVSLALTRPWENLLWLRVIILLDQYGWAIAGSVLMLFMLLFFIRKAGVFQQMTNRWIHRSERSQMAIADFRHAFQLVFTKGRKPFILSMLAITGQWACRLWVLLAVIAATGVQTDFFTAFFLQWMVFVAMLLVPTPGGAGTAEAAFLLVFHTLIPPETVGPVMAGWRLLSYYFVLLLGVGLLISTGKFQGKAASRV